MALTPSPRLTVIQLSLCHLREYALRSIQTSGWKLKILVAEHAWVPRGLAEFLSLFWGLYVQLCLDPEKATSPNLFEGKTFTLGKQLKWTKACKLHFFKIKSLLQITVSFSCCCCLFCFYILVYEGLHLQLYYKTGGGRILHSAILYTPPGKGMRECLAHARQQTGPLTTLQNERKQISLCFFNLRFVWPWN